MAKAIPTKPVPVAPPVKTIVGTEQDDYLSGDPNIFTSQEEVFQGLGGNDVIEGRRGSDQLFGGDGNDILAGGDRELADPYSSGSSLDASADYLNGGAGDDILMGGLGADTYVWGRGFGNDTITEANYSEIAYLRTNNYLPVPGDQIAAGNTSNIQLSNLRPRDIEMFYQGEGYHQQISIRIKNTGETLTFDSAGGLTSVNLTFADGKVWNTERVQQELLKTTSGNDQVIGFRGVSNYLDGGNGQDYLTGGDLADTLSGGKGNDVLVGGGGDDVLAGDAGRDAYVAGSGYDTFLFGRGSNTDALVSNGVWQKGHVVLDKGIKAKDIDVLRNGDALVLQIKGTSDRLELDHYFSVPPVENGAYSGAITLQFNDGTVWDQATLQAKAQTDKAQAGIRLTAQEGQALTIGTLGKDTLIGDAGSNTLLGRGGDDVLDGKGGADTLVGGEGRDTYILGRNYGDDVVSDADGDVLRLAAGIEAKDVTAFYKGDGLKIVINSTPEELASGIEASMLLGNFVSQTALGTGAIEFADGTRWTQADLIKSRYSAGEDDNYLTGTSGNDTIDGLGGNDVIFGEDGDDTLIGGDGYDNLIGGFGNDALFGGALTDNLAGELGDDHLDGGADTDYLYGGEGNDVLIGGEGDDHLSGDAGDDYFVGGAGDDHYFDFQGVSTVELSGEFGRDTYESNTGLGNGLKLLLDGKPSDYQLSLDNFAVAINKGANQLQFGGLGLEGLLLLAPEIQFGDGTLFTGSAAQDWLVGSMLTTGSTSGDDKLSTSADQPVIAAGDGDDTIKANADFDYLIGGNGRDNLWGGVGQDQMFGGAGDDILLGNGGGDSLYGGSGNDQLTAHGFFYGGAGNDVLVASAGDELDREYAAQGITFGDAMNGGDGDDVLDGNTGYDDYNFTGNFGHDTVIDGDIATLSFDGLVKDYTFATNASGNLLISRGDNQVTVTGDAHQHNIVDQMYFGYGQQVLSHDEVNRLFNLTTPPVGPVVVIKDGENIGTEAADLLEGGKGADVINGLGGDDTLWGKAGDDRIYGGTGRDTIYGGDGNDFILGYSGVDGDQLVDFASDFLYGEGGNDSLMSGAGKSVLNGGTGDDFLIGGTGFNYVEIARGDGNDTIGFNGLGGLVLQDFTSDQLSVSNNNGQLRISLGADQRLDFKGSFEDTLQRITFLQTSDGNWNGEDVVTFLNKKIGEPIALPALAKPSAETIASHNQLDLLLSAMAGFAPEAASSGAFGVTAFDSPALTLSVNPGA